MVSAAPGVVPRTPMTAVAEARARTPCRTRSTERSTTCSPSSAPPGGSALVYGVPSGAVLALDAAAGGLRSRGWCCLRRRVGSSTSRRPNRILLSRSSPSSPPPVAGETRSSTSRRASASRPCRQNNRSPGPSRHVLLSRTERPRPSRSSRSGAGIASLGRRSVPVLPGGAASPVLNPALLGRFEEWVEFRRGGDGLDPR